MPTRGELTSASDLQRTGGPEHGDTNGQEANRPTARDQHRFASHIFGQHGIDRIPQGLLTGGPFHGDSRIVLPHIDFRKRHVLGKGAIGIHAQNLEVSAHLGLARAALVAMPTGNMGFGRDQVAHSDALDVCAHGNNFAGGFMPKNTWQRQPGLGPRVPIIDVHICPASNGRRGTQTDQGLMRTAARRPGDVNAPFCVFQCDGKHRVCSRSVVLPSWLHTVSTSCLQSRVRPGTL